MAQQKQMEDLRAEMAQKHARIFASSEGRQLLALLERRFFSGDLMGRTPEETAFNLGAREVVRTMRDLAALVTKPET
jgi:hypothetical protein